MNVTLSTRLRKEFASHQPAFVGDSRRINPPSWGILVTSTRLCAGSERHVAMPFAVDVTERAAQMLHKSP